MSSWPGLPLPIFSDSGKYGIGHYPLRDTLILAAHTLLQWLVLGMVVALFIKPGKKA